MDRKLHDWSKLRDYVDNVLKAPQVESAYEPIEKIDFETALKKGQITFEKGFMLLEYKGIKRKVFVYMKSYNIAVHSRPRAHYSKCQTCLLYTSPSPRDRQKSRMPSSA